MTSSRGSAAAPPHPPSAGTRSRLPRRRPRRARDPGAKVGRVRWVLRLPLAELEALARARLPVLLALLHARVAGQEALAPEQRIHRLVLAHERSCDRHADGAGLAREPAARDAHAHVELVGDARHGERVERVPHECLAAQVVERGAAVHERLPLAREQAHARHGFLPAAGQGPRGRGRRRRQSGPPQASMVQTSGCCAACGCCGPAYTLTFFTIARPSRFRGTMPFTAFSTTRSGCFASTSVSRVQDAPPGYMLWRKYFLSSGLVPVSRTFSALITMT